MNNSGAIKFKNSRLNTFQDVMNSGCQEFINDTFNTSWVDDLKIAIASRMQEYKTARICIRKDLSRF